jgi:hypothetical protein
MMIFFKNLKAAKLLDRRIQDDRRELQIIQNNLSSYFDRYPYELGFLLIGSFLSGLIASFFLETVKLVKIVNSSYVKFFRAFMRYIPMLI